ncbi:hypothetical protein L2E82_16457 [Cichorium intybus]|uniref:Uncharacterized protein n=1 Tax=Cichorium intybus TaxID=13427 RepID=A0ACB9F670_CICIN|nr:hypothetical protein L2E82_16457 [Cichorium intybus]
MGPTPPKASVVDHDICRCYKPAKKISDLLSLDFLFQESSKQKPVATNFYPLFFQIIRLVRFTPQNCPD